MGTSYRYVFGRRSFAMAAAIILLWLPTTMVGQTTRVLVDPPVIVPANTLTINDIDFTHATAPKLLFTIQMRTEPPGSTVTATMTLRARIPAYNPDVDVVFIETAPFEINSIRVITNLDLGKSVPLRTNILDAGGKAWLQNVALPSGSIPAGAYQFTVTVTPVTGLGDEKSFEIDILNPSSIEPIFPLDGDQVPTPFPLFQWRYDGNAQLWVFEKLESQGSLEEAASGVPLLSAESATQSYQYPSSGVRSLLPGKTYVWYVEGLVPTSGGTSVSQKSPLNWFTVAPEGGAAGPALDESTSSLLDELERTLGPKYRPLFDRIRALQLLPQGVARLNGQVITNADLIRLLERLRANPDSVMSVELE